MSLKRSNEPINSLVPATKKTRNEVVAYAAKSKRVYILFLCSNI